MRKNGFSLAEVLIVLGLLGVIAVFTIPKIVGGGSDKKHNAVVNEAAALVQSAYSKYQLDHRANADTALLDLTPYMKFVKMDSITSIDGRYTNTTLDCSNASHICIQLHSGARMFFKKLPAENGFGDIADTNAVWFQVDPDGKITDGTTNGPGKSTQFFLYFNGKTKDIGTIDATTVGEFSASSPDPSVVPPYFSWEY